MPTFKARRRAVSRPTAAAAEGPEGLGSFHFAFWLSVEQRLHLGDLCLLARNDLPAEPPDFLITNGCLLTHENGCRVMGNHGVEELPVADGRLLSDEQPKRDQGQHANPADQQIELPCCGTCRA